MTDHKLDHFSEQGFAVVPGAFNAATCETLCAELQRVMNDCATLDDETRQADFCFEKDLSEAARHGIPAADVGEAIFLAGDLGKYSALFRDLFLHPLIRGTASQLLGTQALVAHFINATIKHPHFGRRIAWHRDYPNAYICTANSDFLRIMLCLDGMHEDGGATRFVPGSHRVSDEEAALAQSPDAKPRLADDAGVAVECAPGDLVVIHPKVLHGGPMNSCSRIRRNIVLQIGHRDATLTGLREHVTGRPLHAPTTAATETAPT